MPRNILIRHTVSIAVTKMLHWWLSILNNQHSIEGKQAIHTAMVLWRLCWTCLQLFYKNAKSQTKPV